MYSQCSYRPSRSAVSDQTDPRKLFSLSSVLAGYYVSPCVLQPGACRQRFLMQTSSCCWVPYLSLSSSREARSFVVQSPNTVDPFPRTAAACLESGHVVNPFLPWRESPLACRASAGLIIHSFLPVVLLGFDIHHDQIKRGLRLQLILQY